MGLPDSIYSCSKLRSIFRNSSQIFRINIELNISRYKWSKMSYLASLLVDLGEVPGTKFGSVQQVLTEIYPMVLISVG